MGISLTGKVSVEGAIQFGARGQGQPQEEELIILWDNGTTLRKFEFEANLEAWEHLMVQDQYGHNFADEPVFTVVSGSLPEGISLAPNGVLSGFPVIQDETTTAEIKVVSGTITALLTLEVSIFWVG